ncbi:MAG: SLC13 family permease [Spirochaetota bacterium]|nr:SLC13 family permease [Spirochaetota bacterium]
MYYIALIIFIITYSGIIFTRLPWVNVDRPSAAYFGAVAMILTGVLSFEEAIAAIDFNTIALLLGMMIVIATLELDGFFAFIAQKTISFSRTPLQLLWIITFTTGIASAFLVNDAVVLMFTPIIISICRSAQLDPKPYLIAEILASNVGSAMTITGNPQNMLIGIYSGIPYLYFLLHLLPISIIGMIIIVVCIKRMYSHTFEIQHVLHYSQNEYEYNLSSMIFSVPIFILITLFFLLHHVLDISIPLIALTGSSLILLLGKIKPSKIIKEIDWVLLLFFASLFIVVKGAEKAGILSLFLKFSHFNNSLHSITLLHAVSLVFSQIVSNVPFVILLGPTLKYSNSNIIWLALASSSTLAGNATIIGAMANLIVLESAAKSGIKISFMEFLKPGIIVTVLTLMLSIAVLYFYSVANSL